MAAAGYPIAFFMPEQRARARIHADGSAVVQTATQEFGTGVLTMATQVAADALGVDVSAMEFQAGDSDLPNSTSAVGSAGAGMVSSAVHAAGRALRRQLVEMAIGDERSPLHGVGADSVERRRRPHDLVRAAGRRRDATASCSPATTWPTPRRWAPGDRRRPIRRTGC